MKERKVSDKQRIANRINPLKHGRDSKYFSPRLAEFVKNPMLLSNIMLETIDKLKDENLSNKERIAYANTLSGIYKTIFGSKSYVNLEVKPDSAKSMQEVYDSVK